MDLTRWWVSISRLPLICSSTMVIDCRRISSNFVETTLLYRLSFPLTFIFDFSFNGSLGIEPLLFFGLLLLIFDELRIELRSLLSEREVRLISLLLRYFSLAVASIDFFFLWEF
jgi:hypothetical protein